MFCRNCGQQLGEVAKFCAKCGTAVNGSIQSKIEVKIKKVEDNEIKYALKPTFKAMYKLAGNFSTALIMAFIILISWFSEAEGLKGIVPISTVAIIAGVIIVFYTLIKTIIDSLQYNDLEYNFYNTKIEYKDGFVNKEEKELKYKYIREVTMTRGVFERMFGLGTVNIFTNASSGGSGTSHGNMNTRNGIHIHCLSNVEEEYKKIKQIIDEGTED